MNVLKAQKRVLSAYGPDILRADEPLSEHTSFRIGGPALLLATPPDIETLRRLLAVCAEEGIPWFVLGRGTNLLVSDRGYQGMAIHLGRGWGWLSVSGQSIDAGPGCPLPALARHAASEGLSGLEFAAGIPGSLGGAVSMNAGAFGGSISSVVKSVDCLTAEGEEIVLDNAEMAFAYRHSRLLAEPMIAVRVNLTLAPADPQDILRQMQEFQAQRKARQPLSAWSAGSVFRNPPGDSAGRLAEAAGCKGLRRGGALVSPKHANFIVNTGAATADDVLALVQEVQHRVWEHCGIWLQPEITLVGDFDAPMLDAPPA